MKKNKSFLELLKEFPGLIGELLCYFVTKHSLVICFVSFVVTSYVTYQVLWEFDMSQANNYEQSLLFAHETAITVVVVFGFLLGLTLFVSKLDETFGNFIASLWAGVVIGPIVYFVIGSLFLVSEWKFFSLFWIAFISGTFGLIISRSFLVRLMNHFKQMDHAIKDGQTSINFQQEINKEEQKRTNVIKAQFGKR